MKRISTRRTRLLFRSTIAQIVAVVVISIQGCSSDSPLEPWHTEKLTEEFTVAMTDDQVRNFDDYLALEQRLFSQLDEKVYANTATGPAHTLKRYSAGSSADPRRIEPNWNRSFEFHVDAPVGGVLLLHGMSDSPYSLRALGKTLNQRGYQVVGLRLPGHGTAPSGLKHVTWQDMAAAVKLAMDHLANSLGPRPIHMVGYSTGAPLSLDFTLNAIEEAKVPVPASLVLISPAIRVHPTGALAGFKNALAALPGLGGLAYLSIMDEFDPYKYNSFATNAGAQVHRITRDVDQRMQALAQNPAAADKLPPILVLKSTVDSTVTTDAVVDNLLMHLPANRNELVLFDINRNTAIKSTMLVSDPGPLTHRMMADQSLPFAVTFVTNENPHSARVVARRKAPFSLEKSDTEHLDLSWPRGVVSLSHVALPIPPDDPLYGQHPPTDDELVFLGDMAIKGERGLLKIPGDWLLRLRYNPFYPYLQTRVLQWLDGDRAVSEVAPGL
ncbi:MAG: alpha/beta hydrolase [Pseudomonadota bacterium]|nr:alpha/beta hydrolase [Pseudomonadota bacterium]